MRCATLSLLVFAAPCCSTPAAPDVPYEDVTATERSFDATLDGPATDADDLAPPPDADDASMLVCGDAGNDGNVCVCGATFTGFESRRYVLFGLNDAVFTADVNDDGHTDVLVRSFTAARDALMLGDGTGAFTTRALALSGALLAVGDVNGDGHVDLVTATPALAVQLGRGDGTFESASVVDASMMPLAAGLGDLDHDGRDDLVVNPIAAGDAALSNTVGAATIAVYLARGGTTFGPPTSVSLSGSRNDFGVPGAIVVQDVDGDGARDVLVTGVSTGTASFLRGDGRGGLLPPVDSVLVATAPSAMLRGTAVGDWNGDSVTDLAVIIDDTLEVSAGRLGGQFLPARSTTLAHLPNGIATGDFNGDGAIDLAIAIYGSGSVALSFGTGTGVFVPGNSFAAGSQPTDVASADLDGDGHPDLAVPSRDGASATVLLERCP